VAKKKKEKCADDVPAKRGPEPMGLGTPFTLRVFLHQEEKILSEMARRGVSKGTVIREKLRLG
jgi:hypothetical protein